MNEISWDNYFMGIARLASCRSKDPVCKVGCVIVKDKHIISSGYNGFPKGISNETYPWTKGNEDKTKNKFYYVVHAELNAILYSTPNDINGSTIYVTRFPCNECAKAIIQSGIKKVIYDYYEDGKEFDVVNKFLKDGGVEIEHYVESGLEITIKM